MVHMVCGIFSSPFFDRLTKQPVTLLLFLLKSQLGTFLENPYYLCKQKYTVKLFISAFYWCRLRRSYSDFETIRCNLLLQLNFNERIKCQKLDMHQLFLSKTLLNCIYRQKGRGGGCYARVSIRKEKSNNIS